MKKYVKEQTVEFLRGNDYRILQFLGSSKVGEGIRVSDMWSNSERRRDRVASQSCLKPLPPYLPQDSYPKWFSHWILICLITWFPKNFLLFFHPKTTIEKTWYQLKFSLFSNIFLQSYWFLLKFKSLNIFTNAFL